MKLKAQAAGQGIEEARPEPAADDWAELIGGEEEVAEVVADVVAEEATEEEQEEHTPALDALLNDGLETTEQAQAAQEFAGSLVEDATNPVVATTVVDEVLAADPLPADTSYDSDSTDEESLVEIKRAREKVRRCEQEFVAAREETKDAKKSWEAAVKELTETIDNLTRPLPLFDGKAAAKQIVQGAAKMAEKSGTAESSQDATEAPDTPAPTPTQTQEIPPEAVATIRVRLLTEIEAGGIIFGHDGEVLTAYIDDDGSICLALKDVVAEGEDEQPPGWQYAYLDAEEFEEIGEEQEVGKAKEAMDAAIGGTKAAGTTAWQGVTVEALGLPPGICQVLREENSIGTLGALADWTAGGGSGRGRELTELKKIGQAKADKIQEACDRYWREHPQR